MVGLAAPSWPHHLSRLHFSPKTKNKPCLLAHGAIKTQMEQMVPEWRALRTWLAARGPCSKRRE